MDRQYPFDRGGQVGMSGTVVMHSFKIAEYQTQHINTNASFQLSSTMVQG